MGKFYKAAEKDPPADGEYRVIRRGLRGRPEYEDLCRFERGQNGQPFWMNKQGMRISTVVWWEEKAN